MGAHGTLDDALANVASFASASIASSSLSDRTTNKHRSNNKHKKAKDKAKDKKDTHKKHKKHKHSSASGSSFDDEVKELDLDTQLAKGREAARITRRILLQYPDMRADLRQVDIETAAVCAQHLWLQSAQPLPSF